MVVPLLNIQGLKVEKAEYCEAKGYTDMTLRSKSGVVRLAIKDNGENLPMFVSDKEYTLTLSQTKNTDKYSNDSFRYFWALCTRLSNAMSKDKNELAKDMIESYGVSDTFKGLAEINFNKYFKHWKPWVEREEDGKSVAYIKVYKDLKEYDQNELNNLIRGVKQECADLNIDTSTPSEVSLYG